MTVERAPAVARGVLCGVCNQDRWSRYGTRWGCRICRNAAAERWRAKVGPAFRMYHTAKTRAKRSGIPFTIKYTDIVIPATCPILDIPIYPNAHQCGPNSPSLDRIRSDEGYVQGNVQVVSHRANTLKNSASCAELERVLSYLTTSTGKDT